MDKTDEHCNTKVSTKLDNNRSSITVAPLLMASFLYIIFFLYFSLNSVPIYRGSYMANFALQLLTTSYNRWRDF